MTSTAHGQTTAGPGPRTPGSAADSLALASPQGRISLSGPLLDVLYERIAAAGGADPRIPPAVGAGDEVAYALAAGCPPQFHPGVPPEHATVLAELRRSLGLADATAVEVPASTRAEVVRVLRAIGCTVEASEPAAPAV